MNTRLDIQTEALADEVVRYLDAIAVFRALDCEPTWQPELVPSDALIGLGRGDRSLGLRPSDTRQP